MVDSRGHVTVMDFGLARDLRAESVLPRGPVGTPAYWSPEQGRGERAVPVSDLFSLGVISLRLFQTEAGLEKAPLLAVPTPYRHLIARCLEHDPTKRIDSARSLLRELNAAREQRRRPGPTLVMATASAIAVVAVVIAAWSLGHLPGRDATNPRSLPTTPHAPPLAELPPAFAPVVAAAPSQLSASLSEPRVSASVSASAPVTASGTASVPAPAPRRARAPLAAPSKTADVEDGGIEIPIFE